MRKKLRLLLSACLLGMFTLSCDDSLVTDDLDIVVDADVIRYSVLFQIKDATGETPADLNVSIAGEDAEIIYDLAGNKNLAVSNGLLSVGVHPKNEPTLDNPVSFTVKLSGPGYITANIPVTIEKDEFSQVLKPTILKIDNTPKTVTVKQETAAIASTGTTTTPITVSTTETAETPVETKVEVPANTGFLSETGAPISGSSVSMNVVNYNTKSDVASGQHIADLFPGGKLAATDVTGPNNTKISAFFAPAGLTAINFEVNGQEVKKFTQPINIEMELNPEFRLPGSSTPIQSGDKIGIWSYSESTAKWTYEREGTIEVVNSKPLVRFTTDHLTIFSAAAHADITACKNPSLTFKAAWLNNDSAPLEIEIWNQAGTDRLFKHSVIAKHDLKFILKGLPTTALKYRVFSHRRELFAEGNMSSPCDGGNTDIQLKEPVTPFVGITLSVTVKCPDKGVITPPDFHLFYKPVGSTANWELIGVVRKGSISTTLLEVGKRYDFLAKLGPREKQINNHLIDKKDMSTTVGVDDNLGSVTPEQNRAILIEECNKL